MTWFDFSHKELPKTILKISTIFYAVLAFLLVIVALFTQLWVLPLWWTIGGVIAIVNYLTILLQTKLLQDAALAGNKKGFGGNLYIVRLTLSGLGLFLAAYVTLDPTLKLWAIGTVFIAYLLNSFMILVIGNFLPKKPKL